MRKRTSKIWTIPKNELQNLLNTSNSLKEVLKKLKMDEGCGNHRPLNQRIREDELCLDVLNRNRKIYLSQKRCKKKIPNDKIFIRGSLYNNRQSIKKRMQEDYNIEYKCKKCNIGDTYNGHPIVLQLDHINGINNDNRINNLRFLCPNCHSQTDTFSGKGHRKPQKIHKCPNCNNNFKGYGKICKTCSNLTKNKQKINWPSADELKEMVWQYPTLQLSKKLGVSDVAISNQCKKYNIEKPPRGYWNRIKYGESHEEAIKPKIKEPSHLSKITINDIPQILEMRKNKMSFREIGLKYNVAHTTISRLLKQNGAA